MQFRQRLLLEQMQGRDLPGTVKNPPANRQGHNLAHTRSEGVSGFEVGEPQTRGRRGKASGRRKESGDRNQEEGDGEGFRGPDPDSALPTANRFGRVRAPLLFFLIPDS